MQFTPAKPIRVCFMMRCTPPVTEWRVHVSWKSSSREASPEVVAVLCWQLVVLTYGLCHGSKSQVEDKGRQQAQHDRACDAEPQRYLHIHMLAHVWCLRVPQRPKGHALCSPSCHCMSSQGVQSKSRPCDRSRAAQAIGPPRRMVSTPRRGMLQDEAPPVLPSQLPAPQHLLPPHALPSPWLPPPAKWAAAVHPVHAHSITNACSGPLRPWLGTHSSVRCHKQGNVMPQDQRPT